MNVCTLCQLINLIFHDVQRLCRLIIEPECKSYRDLLYITLFCLFVCFFCCCYCLFVVCVVYFVITSSLYRCMCAILHKNVFFVCFSFFLFLFSFLFFFLFLFSFSFVFLFFPIVFRSSIFCLKLHQMIISSI